jgi:transcriptional regulator with XRE-family HTH domain
MDDIRERFRAVRKALGLTMDAFGRSIGLSNSGISAIESGQRSVTDKHIKLICAAHPSVSEHWLRTGEGEMFAPSDSDIVAEVCKTYSLDSAGRLLLETVLDLPDGYAKVLLDVALKLAERSAAASAAADPAEIDIDREVAEYRAQLELEKRAAEKSARSHVSDA